MLGLLFRKFRQQIRAGVPKIPANKIDVRDAYFAKMAVPQVPGRSPTTERVAYLYVALGNVSAYGISIPVCLIVICVL